MALSSQGYYGTPPSYMAPPAPPPSRAQFSPHYPPQGHHYPPPPPQPAPIPAPPPTYYLGDPASFRREFMKRLSELTVNSRPIIQNLSMLAHEYPQYSDIVAQSLESHIRQVPPWVKLPALYLLDMISKNIFDPYARRFSSFIVPLILESYRQVDDITRSKIEELVMTWRTGSPTRNQLFGAPAQMAIERGIWGDGSNVSNMSGPSHISKAQVLSELEFTLGQKERALQINPYDTLSQGHVSILHQLRSLVDTGVSQDELKQILSQLHSLGRTTGPPPPQQLPPTAGPSTWQPPVATLPPPPHIPAPAPSLGYPVPPISLPLAAGPPSGITDLLSTLLKAGVVSKSNTPVGAVQEEDSQTLRLERDASRSYRNAILSQNIRLTISDITRKRTPISDFLYNSLGSQCKQCGLRFPDTALGRKNKQEHLDFHFKQNRKAKDNVGRGHARSWFVSLDDWTHEIVDAKGKGTADSSRIANPKAAAAAAQAQRDAELRAQYVVVPPGDEATLVACPICKETLQSEFLEDDEEWVWKNAVKKDDRVYHATCHADALNTTTSLAVRLRNELLSNGRSRSVTPDHLTPPSSASIPIKQGTPPPDAGVKRKVEDTASTELDGTPPNKKIALTI